MLEEEFNEMIKERISQISRDLTFLQDLFSENIHLKERYKKELSELKYLGVEFN